MHYENYICHTAAFQWCLQGFLKMNCLKVCTLLSFMEQLQNTGPPLSSSACVLHVCPRILQVQNKHTKWIHMIHDSQVYTCSDTNLGKFLFHYIYCFVTKKIWIFQVKFIIFPSVEFPKICWTIEHICVLPSACQ